MFQVDIVSAGNSFGVFCSHFQSTVFSMSTPVYVGNETHFYSIQELTVFARRPLSASCRAEAVKLCGAKDKSACRSCVPAPASRDILEDAGCDMDQSPDLTAYACAPSPSASCLGEVAKACPIPKGGENWLKCEECIDEAHRAAPIANCSGSSAMQVVYSYCVDGK